MSVIVTFGHLMFSNNSIPEWTTSCRVIESAFISYREQLVAFMKELGSIFDEMGSVCVSRTRSADISGISSNFGEMMGEIPRLWELNEIVLRELVNPIRSLKFVYGLLGTSNYILDTSSKSLISPPSANQPNTFTSYNSLDQILIHLSRDWSEAGVGVREKLYHQGVLSVIREVFPPNARDDSTRVLPHVLVPGAGLGRLAVEIASMGFRVEMNELSSSMVCSFQSIMDILRHRTVRTESESESDSASAREFYPNLNFFLIDDWDFSARLRPQRFPFTSDSPTLDQMLFGGCDADADRRCDKDRDKDKGALSPLFDRLTVQFGGFDAVYSASNSDDHANRFDLVVTCFFIDTAENILDYIAVIYHVLRPGGLWINVGPLHYHSYGKQRQQAQTGRSRLAGDDSPRTVPYSYTQLLQLIAALGFDELNLTKTDDSTNPGAGSSARRFGLGRVVEVSYCGEDASSMKPEVYRVPLAAFRSRKQ